MKKLKASSAIGMLLALLIISLLFILMMPTLKDIGTGSGSLGTSSINKQSVESKVNKQIEEIENMRRQTIDINKRINQEY